MASNLKSIAIGPNLLVNRGALGRSVCALFALGLSVSIPGNCSSHKQLRESPNAIQVILNAPISDVLAATNEIVGDTVVYGTQSFQRERNLTGARRIDNSGAFGESDLKGTILYKVAEGVLSPTNFKNSADIGTITVRYVLTPFDEKNTNIRIDAVFIENSTRRIHESDGSVEAAEFGEIRQRLEHLQAQHEIDRLEAERIAHERSTKQAELDLMARQQAAGTKPVDTAGLEKRVAQLRKKAEVRIKASGTLLKSAPYKGASNLQTLSAYTDVVVLVVTPYWYGVQTADGHRGWVYHREVEDVP